MLNSKDGGKVYGIPFQRSTPVLYYNKDLFKEVGLNPEQAPKTWAEMVDAAKKLTKPDGSRWGVEIPSDGFPYWVFQGMAIGNGKNFVDDTGAKIFFNDPAVVQALDAWVSLGTKDKVEPASIVIWNTTPDDFHRWQGGDDLAHDRLADEHPQEREVPGRRRLLARPEATRRAHRRRELLSLQEDAEGEAASGVEVHPVPLLARVPSEVDD